MKRRYGRSVLDALAILRLWALLMCRANDIA